MIVIRLTNGFGNNLFQYNAARLLAEYLGQEAYCIPPTQDYYAINSLKSLGLRFLDNTKSISGVVIPENSYKLCFDEKHKNETFILSGYFEDYRYFHKDLEKIKGWYPKIEKRNNKDLEVGGD